MADPIRHDSRTGPPPEKYGAPGISFPTPNVDDVIVVEEVPIGNANFTPLDYDTPHPYVTRAKLVFQAPVKGNNREKSVRRIYATTRDGQDAYNYAVSFESDAGFPSVIRSYVLLREDYDRLPDFDLDPEFTSAELVKEDMRPIEDGELRSLFVSVTRVYQQLPGSLTTEQLASDAAHGSTLRTSQIVKNTGAEEASITVTGSTVTRTTYSETSNILLLKKVTETYQKDGQLLLGQEYNDSLGLEFPYTEQVEDFSDPDAGAASLGVAGAEVIPIDTRSSRVRRKDQAATNAKLAAFVPREFPDTIRLQLPDVLIGLGIVYNVQRGEGEGSSASVIETIGASSPIALGTPARSSSSITITASPVVTMKQFWGQEKTPARRFKFFVHGNFTIADLLTRLSASDAVNATVNAWPSFKPQSYALSLQSGQLSMSANANLDRKGVNNTSLVTTSTTGISIETGGSSPTLNIPACLHGHIVITNPTRSETLTVDASSTFTGAPPFIPDATADSTRTETVVASITPTELGQTSPAAVPTSGNYLSPDYQVREFDSENFEVNAWVVDMAFFLSYTIAATPSTIGYGTITGIGEFDPGATVTLVATPIGGHTFTNWTVGVTVVSSSATYTFTAAADRVLVAHFA